MTTTTSTPEEELKKFKALGKEAQIVGHIIQASKLLGIPELDNVIQSLKEMPVKEAHDTINNTLRNCKIKLAYDPEVGASFSTSKYDPRMNMFVPAPLSAIEIAILEASIAYNRSKEMSAQHPSIHAVLFNWAYANLHISQASSRTTH